jgi:hypothetical protein
VYPRAGLDDLEKRKFLTLSGLEHRPLGRPVRVPGAPSPGLNRQEREADHSSPASAEIKKIWIYTSLPYTPSWRRA